MITTVTPVETDALAARTKATWMAGDFGKIAKSYEPGAAEFIERLHFQPGEQVLDVACGTGNLAIPAARSGAQVTGIDIAPNLVEQAQAWAHSEGLAIRFEEGNAEQMPYADASFDAVVTMFGAMFAPRPASTAAELVRVCRPGGRIAMANWMPDGFIGQMFKIIGKHVPPAQGRTFTAAVGQRSNRGRTPGRPDCRSAMHPAHDHVPFSVQSGGDGGILPHLLWPHLARLCHAQSRGARGITP